MKTIPTNNKGFAVIGIVVALVILGSMAAALSTLVATNQTTRVSQIYVDQAFYVSQAAFEATLRTARVNRSSALPTRQFVGSNFSLARSGGRLYSQGRYGITSLQAANTFSICDPGSATACFIILSNNGNGALSLNGGATLSTGTCGINVNSSSPNAVSIVGNSTLNTAFLNVVGGINSGSGTVDVCGNALTGTSPYADPLLAYNMPAYSACTYTNYSTSSSATLNPGVYCGGITITGSGTITMNPGNYILDGGDFSVAGSSAITGTGVTIFLNRQLESKYAGVKITGSGPIALRAPTSGTYNGILIFQSRNAPNGTNNINGGTGLALNGVIYLPSQELSFSGGSATTSACILFVVSKLSLSGNSNVSCSSGDLGGLIG